MGNVEAQSFEGLDVNSTSTWITLLEEHKINQNALEFVNLGSWIPKGSIDRIHGDT